jgi:hypothetical protein
VLQLGIPAGFRGGPIAPPSARLAGALRWRSTTARRLCLFAASCLALSSPLAASGAGRAPIRSAAELDAAYTATLFGFPIGDIVWKIELREKRFSAAASGHTAGLLRIFARGHGSAKADGILTAQRPLATNFFVSYTHGGGLEQTKILFRGGKAKEYIDHPPPTNPNLVPLTEASRTGVVDPMTALLVHVPGNGDTTVPAACDRKVAVFDGHMRYDLRLAFKRFEEVRADTGYHGRAVVCAVYFTPLAGYDPTRYAIKYLRAERGMEIWLAPLAGTRLLAPFRVSVPTPLGVGVLQATRFVWTWESAGSSATSIN